MAPTQSRVTRSPWTSRADRPGVPGRTITLRAVVSAKGTLHVLPVGRDPSGCDAPFAPSGCWSRCCRQAPSTRSRTLPVPTGTRRPATTPCWATGTTRRAATSSSCGTTGPTRPSPGARSWPTAAPGPSTRRSPGSPWSAGPTRRRVARGTGSSSTTCGQRTSARLALQGDLGRNDCDVAWQGTGWVRLAPVSQPVFNRGVTDPSPWQTELLDLDAYLGRIGAAAAPPSRAALDALHEAHVRAFTFDNIDVLLDQHPGVGARRGAGEVRGSGARRLLLRARRAVRGGAGAARLRRRAPARPRGWAGPHALRRAGDPRR